MQRGFLDGYLTGRANIKVATSGGDYGDAALSSGSCFCVGHMRCRCRSGGRPNTVTTDLYAVGRADVQTILRRLPRCGRQGPRPRDFLPYDASPGLDHTREASFGQVPLGLMFQMFSNLGQVPLLHGSSDMPTWGPIFRYFDKQNERVVQQRIKNLCDYLASLQEH